MAYKTNKKGELTVKYQNVKFELFKNFHFEDFRGFQQIHEKLNHPWKTN